MKEYLTMLPAKHGTAYRYGSTMKELYQASGSDFVLQSQNIWFEFFKTLGTSPDHAYGHFNTPLAYTYEFRAGLGI